jgi:hypothetical protein
MSFPHEGILHGTPCDCTLHDIGLNCRRKLTEDDLQRELAVLLCDATGSGLSPERIDRAWAAAQLPARAGRTSQQVQWDWLLAQRASEKS